MPGSSIQSVRDWMEEMVSKISKKVLFICWDFNIDLLDLHKQKNDWRIHLHSVQCEPVSKNDQTQYSNITLCHFYR